MAIVSRILSPTDLSPKSMAAFRYAIFLGENFGANVDALHVWHSNTKERTPSVHADSKDAFREFVAQLRIRGQVKIRRRLEHGDPAMTIITLAINGSYDLVVLMTSGKGTGSVRPPVSELTQVGNVAEMVFKSCPSPVLVVPEPRAPTIPPRNTNGEDQPSTETKPSESAKRLATINSVLVAVELSPSCAGPLAHASLFARTFKVPVEVLHVIPRPDDSTADMERNMRMAEQEHAKRYLQERIAVTEGLSGVEPQIAFGDAYGTIAERAVAGHHGLLVIGRSRAPHLAKGSVGETGGRLLRRPPCPVLMVQPPRLPVEGREPVGNPTN